MELNTQFNKLKYFNYNLDIFGGISTLNNVWNKNSNSSMLSFCTQYKLRNLLCIYTEYRFYAAARQAKLARFF